VRRDEGQERAEALLRRIPLFSAVPQHRLRTIAHLAHRNTFAAAQILFKEGEPGSTLHVIRYGQLSVLGERDGGQPLVLASLGPGEFVGELALFDRGPRSATVMAAVSTETLSISRVDILDLMNRYPEVALALLHAVCRRLRSTDNLLENFGRPGDLADPATLGARS
jgi:CRP-like cAMP-binding protein